MAPGPENLEKAGAPGQLQPQPQRKPAQPGQPEPAKEAAKGKASESGEKAPALANAKPPGSATAIEAARFLTQKMSKDGKLLHNYRAGKADVSGMLEDYADVAYGLLALYEATKEKEWLDGAVRNAPPNPRRFANDPEGIDQLVAWARDFGPERIVFESTGLYQK